MKKGWYLGIKIASNGIQGVSNKMERIHTKTYLLGFGTLAALLYVVSSNAVSCGSFYRDFNRIAYVCKAVDGGVAVTNYVPHDRHNWTNQSGGRWLINNSVIHGNHLICTCSTQHHVFLQVRISRVLGFSDVVETRTGYYCPAQGSGGGYTV